MGLKNLTVVYSLTNCLTDRRTDALMDGHKGRQTDEQIAIQRDKRQIEIEINMKTKGDWQTNRQKINGYTDDIQENAFELRVVNLTGHFSVVVIAFDYMKQKTEQQC